MADCITVLVQSVTIAKDNKGCCQGYKLFVGTLQLINAAI